MKNIDTPNQSATSEWEELILAVAAGSDDAFSRLYRQAGGFVRRMCAQVLRNPQDAEEAANDTFAHVWTHAGRYCPTRGTAKAWLANIARSRAIDRRRWLDARRLRWEEPLSDVEGCSPSPEHLTIRDDLARYTKAALLDLPVHQRETLWLLCVSDCSHQEAAKRLRVPLGTVKTRSRLGVRRLRSQLARRTQFRHQKGCAAQPAGA